MTGFGAAQVIRLALNLVLTRLLFPELLGLMGLVLSVISGINLVCDFGTAAIVIRDPRGDEPVFLDTLWTLQVIRGIGVSIFAALIAMPVAVFYGDHRLQILIPVIGLSSLIGAFTSTSLLTLQRHMAVSRLVIVDVATQIAAGGCMVMWARLAPGIWALVAGTLLAPAVRLAWSYGLHTGRLRRFAWDRSSLHEIFVFGRWIWIATLLTFLATQVDRLTLGKLLTLKMLGIYGIALTISEVPRSLLQSVSGNVIFPAVSRFAHLPRGEFREKIIRHRWSLLAALACLVAVLTATGDGIIRDLYDERYAAAAWMLPMLAIGIWPAALSSTIHPSLAAIGQPRYAALANLWKALFTGIGIPIGFALFGLVGAVMVVALNDLPVYAQIGYGLWREGLAAFAQDIKATLLLLLLLAVAMLIRHALGFGIPFQRHA